MSRLTQIIALLYKMTDDETVALQEDLLKQMTRAWQRGINDEARKFGCSTGRANAPRGEDLREMKSFAKRDAESIAKTYNRDVVREIERLYALNPRGNRRYYTVNMERWILRRNAYKAPQIALMTETNIRQYARQRFWKMNQITAGFRMTPLTATCKECIRIIARGTVSQAFMEKYPCPRHIGCIHEYSTVNVKPARIPCNRMWLG